MKFILQTKDIETQEVISEKKFESIRQIFLDLKGYTYCTVHKNAMYKINNTKQGKKYTQQIFDKKYNIINIDE